jgi:hypothetical protein
MDDSDSVLRSLILQPPRERRALCGVMLAAYRVELTRALHRIAGDGGEESDLSVVDELAVRIATAAAAGQLSHVEDDAVTLQARTAAARDGDSEAQSAMLIAGLRVIDRILAAAPLEAATAVN